MSDSKLPGGCNPADVLYKLSIGRGLQAPVFEQVSEHGPPHCKTFTWSCSFFEGQYKSVGNGRSKKEAKSAAAKNLITQLDLSKLPEKPQRHHHPHKRKFMENVSNGAMMGPPAGDLGPDNNISAVINETAPKKSRRNNMNGFDPSSMGFGRFNNVIPGPGHMMMGMGGFGGGIYPPRRNVEDKYVMEKHMSIYPDETELYNMLQSVDKVEIALKNISDRLCQDGEDTTEEREVTGVARVGDLAKTLMLRGDNTVKLVVMCSNKPTKSLLNKVVTLLTSELAHLLTKQKEYEENEEEVQQEKNSEKDSNFEVSKDSSTGEILVKCQCCLIAIYLTSTLLRENPASQQINDNSQKRKILRDTSEELKDNDPKEEIDDKPKVSEEENEDPDLLSQENGLKALAEVRRAKWFSAMALPLPSCVEAIRIMKDKARRDPAWNALGDWALELLVERALFSVGFALSPSKAILRIMEVVTSGLLLPGGHGIKDPCERDEIDVFDHMTVESREAITRQAQIDLRNIHFKKINVVLGMKKFVRPHKMRSALVNFKKEGDDIGEKEEDLVNELNR